jgi:hypothetical protein
MRLHVVRVSAAWLRAVDVGAAAAVAADAAVATAVAAVAGACAVAVVAATLAAVAGASFAVPLEVKGAERWGGQGTGVEEGEGMGIWEISVAVQKRE